MINNNQCNQCGKMVFRHDIIENNLMHQFNVQFNYGSDFDMTNGCFCLCENCLLCMVNSFKIPIELKEC